LPTAFGDPADVQKISVRYIYIPMPSASTRDALGEKSTR